MFTGAFSYKNHPIYKVDVLGVVVKKVENSKCFIYAGKLYIYFYKESDIHVIPPTPLYVI